MNYKKLSMVLSSISLSLGVYFLLPPECLEPARRMAFIFVLAALFWAFELIPLFATSLLVVLLQSLLIAPTTHRTVYLVTFANPVIILFLGGFVLARALQKYRIDHWLVSHLLRFFGTKPYSVMLGFMITTALLGMWISNTAVTALMLAMIFPLLKHLGAKDAFRKSLVLAIPFAARIGGITTLVGTPTNAIAIGLMSERGIEVNFLWWTLMTLPLAVILLLATSFLLYYLFPTQSKTLKPTLEPVERFDFKTFSVLIIGIATAALWFSSSWHHIPESIVALFLISILSILKLIDAEDIRKINWDILLLMWGGLALGEGMEKSGLASWITSQPIFPHETWLLYLVVCALSAILSTFISNTATVNLLIPIALSIPSKDPALLAAIVALAASFDIALPTATPPMAMAYATKEISIKDMLKAGIIFAVLANGLLLVGAEFMMKRVFIP